MFAVGRPSRADDTEHLVDARLLLTPRGMPTGSGLGGDFFFAHSVYSMVMHVVRCARNVSLCGEGVCKSTLIYFIS